MRPPPSCCTFNNKKHPEVIIVVTSYWSANETLLVVLKETKNNHHETPTFLLYSLVCLRNSLTAHKRYSPISGSLLGTDDSLGYCLSNNGWGSSNGVSGVGNWGSSVGSVGNWGSGIGSSSNWSSMGNSNWDLSNSVDRGGNSLGDSLDGVSAGLVDNWLVNSLVGTDGSRDSLGSKGRDVLEDWLSNVVGLDNGGGLVSGNWGRDVSVGGLSNWMGQGGDLGDDLSEGMSLSGRVSKVSSKSVVLNGCRIMGRSTDKVGGSIANNSGSWGHGHSTGTGKSDERGEKQEGVHGGVVDVA